MQRGLAEAMSWIEPMDRERLGRDLGRLAGVVGDARRLSATRWRQELYALADAPLELRLLCHQEAVREEVREAYPGLDMIQDGYLLTIRALGVVDAGEDVEAVEVATGLALR